MPRIQVRKCPQTGEIYEDDNDYADHLVSLRQKRHKEFDRMTAFKNEQAILRRIRSECLTISDIEKAIQNNWGMFCNRAYKANVENYSYEPGPKPPSAPKFSDVKLGVNHFGMCSGYHRSPIGKPVNWGGRNPDLPTEYLGYSGYFNLNAKGVKSPYGTFEMFEDSGINIFNGSGGDQTKCEFIIFLDDWPGLAEQAAIDRLTGCVNPLVDKYYKDRERD